MKRFGRRAKWLTGVCLVVFFLASGSWDKVRAQALSPDVGLVTEIGGEVTYWNDTYQRTPEKPQAYMKIRPGDRFKVSRGGFIQVVYFQASRQEIWTGPVTLAVGEQESLGDGGAKAKVTKLPAGASQGMRRLPPLLNRAGLSRSGGVQVRGIAPGSAKGPALTAESEAELKTARETYQHWRTQAKADDVTPELYLAGILGDYGQFEEMQEVLKGALQRQPGNELVKDLSAWAAAQR